MKFRSVRPSYQTLSPTTSETEMEQAATRAALGSTKLRTAHRLSSQRISATEDKTGTSCERQTAGEHRERPAEDQVHKGDGRPVYPVYSREQRRTNREAGSG